MLISTPAIVLHSFKYGDSSKIVRLLTRERGVQSAIAKGAFRPRSRFGARLQSLSQGTAQLYVRQTRELQTLAGFDVTEAHPGLAEDVRRYAAAAALGELVLRLSPEERHPEIFDLLSESLDWLSNLPDERVGVVGLAALWRMTSTLGFSPALSSCARDGRPIPEGPARFSVSDGGLLCVACSRGSDTTKLPVADRELLARFLGDTLSPDLVVAGTTPSGDPGRLDQRGAIATVKREAAHRRLLARFIRRHASEDCRLPALEFWERPP
jgi:DNA repair protein RecO (recombination protein O)